LLAMSLMKLKISIYLSRLNSSNRGFRGAGISNNKTTLSAS
jgi:hypothetical protein